MIEIEKSLKLNVQYVEDLVVRGELVVSSVQFGVTKTPDRGNARLDQ